MNLYIQDKKPIIILLGDIILDHSIYGQSSRLANEAPIPVIRHQTETYKLGGAGNVATNLVALGATHVYLFAGCGKDPWGERLCSLFPDTIQFTPSTSLKTTVKHRIYSDQKLICRYDEESDDKTWMTVSEESHIINTVRDLLSTEEVSSIVFSDYNKGFLTPTLCQAIIQLCHLYRIPTIVDPKQSVEKYTGCTIIKPNQIETMRLFEIDVNTIPLDQAHHNIHQRMLCTCSIITMAERGISAYDGSTLYQYQTDPKEVIDVTGAGDMITSVFGIYYPFMTNLSQLIQFACHVATLSVGHLGVYTVTPYDLLRLYRTMNRTKHFQMEQLCHGLSCEKTNQRGKIVFTNGCFDLLHSAHIALFQFCKELAGPTGIVIVGLNSDASIQRLKGDQRPIYPLQERIAMLEALEAVDFIVPFEEDSPYNLIYRIRPDVLVKGGDYVIDAIIGREFAKEVICFPFMNGKSTTNTIQLCHDRNSSK